MNYAKAIKRLRRVRGLSQADLAQAIGKTPGYISKLEIGDRVPATEVIETICKELDVPYYLFALLASDDDNISNLPAKETQILAENLLKVLVGSNDQHR
jgi:transcriptional regulator with XRE-family HTH domain